jgi:ABC-type glycerol-3-phosphate transport system substrate-binding protein
MKKLISAILSVLIALFFTACGGGGGNASSDSVTIPVTISTY